MATRIVLTHMVTSTGLSSGADPESAAAITAGGADSGAGIAGGEDARIGRGGGAEMRGGGGGGAETRAAGGGGGAETRAACGTGTCAGAGGGPETRREGGDDTGTPSEIGGADDACGGSGGTAEGRGGRGGADEACSFTLEAGAGDGAGAAEVAAPIVLSLLIRATIRSSPIPMRLGEDEPARRSRRQPGASREQEKDQASARPPDSGTGSNIHPERCTSAPTEDFAARKCAGRRHEVVSAVARRSKNRPGIVKVSWSRV